MNPDRDSELVTQVCAGRRELFRDLVEAYQTQTYAIAFCQLGNRHLAEEAVQDAFLLAFTKLRTLRKPQLFGPWLCAITRRAVFSILRKKRNHPALDALELEPQAADENPADQMHRRDVADLLREALEKLPKKIAETLTLFYIQENDIAETARILGISEQAVKTRLHRGRELLRRPLEQTLTEELKNLKPSSSLAPAIMAILPSLPSKLGFTGILTPLMGVFTLIQIAWFSFLMLMNSYLLGKSFKNTEDYRFLLRMQYIWKMLPWMILVLILATLLGGYVRGKTVFLYVGLFSITVPLFWLPSAIQAWRVKNVFPLLNHATLILIGLGYCLIGILPAPRQFHSLPFLGFIFIAFLGLRAKIMRGDHSLFLRIAQGDIILPSSKMDFPDNINLKEFSSFLGQELLLVGAEYFPNGSCEFDLAPVNPYHWRPWSKSSLSKIIVDPSSSITAVLSIKDLTSLEKIVSREIFPYEVKELETRVAEAILAAADLFSQGKPSEAKLCLTPIRDQDVFSNKTFSKTPIGIFTYLFLLAYLGLTVYSWIKYLFK